MNITFVNHLFTTAVARKRNSKIKMPMLCIDVLTNTLFPGNLDNTRGCKLTKYILLTVYVALLVFCFNYYCSLEWDAQMKLPTFRHFKSGCMVIWYLCVLLCYLHVDVKTFSVAEKKLDSQDRPQILCFEYSNCLLLLTENQQVEVSDLNVIVYSSFSQ